MPTNADILRRWQEAMDDIDASLDAAIRQAQYAAEVLKKLAEDLRKDGRGV